MTTKVLKAALISAIKNQTIDVNNLVKLIEDSRNPQNASELILGVYETPNIDYCDKMIDGKISSFKNFNPLAYEFAEVEYMYPYDTTYYFRNQTDAENYQKEEYSQYRGNSTEEFPYALDLTISMTGSCSVNQWNNYPIA